MLLTEMFLLFVGFCFFFYFAVISDETFGH